MKKIGIVTFHRADNLGAVLQAYALQSVMRENWNTDVQIIDYVCPGIEKANEKVKGIKAVAARLYYWWKHRCIESFRRSNLILSEKCSAETVHMLSKQYDAFVTGSDQVWNYECSGWDDTYFLNFVSEGKAKYSYAASIGNYRFAPQERQRVQQLLQDFSGISIREESAQQELGTMAVEHAVLCPDPVFLLQRERWQKIMAPRRCRQSYVFVYLIQQDVNVMRSARAYCEANHCKLISNKMSPEFILHGGPAEFLSWIYHADCVFTNSFHGTAFAMIFNRPLAADIQLVNGGVNHRIKDVLHSADAIGCVVSKENAAARSPDADHAIQQMQIEAFAYLDQICREEQ